MANSSVKQLKESSGFKSPDTSRGSYIELPDIIPVYPTEYGTFGYVLHDAAAVVPQLTADCRRAPANFFLLFPNAVTRLPQCKIWSLCSEFADFFHLFTQR